MFGGSGYPGSFNEDVLSAEPSDQKSRMRLVEEIKSRAKGCISSKNFPEAVLLYTKAVELTAGDNAAQAILYANRSMVQLNMSKTTEALIDANEALTLDGSYIKGYYRKAMACSALNDYKSAKEALEAGLLMKPDDKELATQLKKVEEKLQSGTNGKSSGGVPAATKKVTVNHGNSSSTPSSSTVSSSSSSSSSAKPAATSSSSSSKPPSGNNKMDVDDEPVVEEDLDVGNIRGYKKTKDGRTTTFFNHDLDEDTKKLIGNIAPKKLEDVNGEVITTGATVGSAWNAAGTYEEKILTPWVTEYLTACYSSLKLHLIKGSAETASLLPPFIHTTYPNIISVLIDVTTVENVNGHAQVTLIRGKKKHVCDFSLTLKWSLLINYAETCEHLPKSIQGQVNIIDITADKEYELEGFQVNKLNDSNTSLSGLPSDAAFVVNKLMKASDGLFNKAVVNALNVFWTDLKEK